ncbi:MAG: QueT transporter family protein [Clostridia bacterium]|nr:QueT transporter family protein [Clostridia bacterium]
MKLRKAVTAAVIAAVYAALTLILLPLSFGAVQCRISEVLTVLPIFTPVGVTGLTLGCFVSNIFSTVTPVDMLFGTSATLIAALLTRCLRNIKLWKIPFLSLLAPVVVNAVIIGLEITLFVPGNASFTAFLISAASVGIGQLIPCVLLGVPFYLLIEKSNLKKFFK